MESIVEAEPGGKMKIAWVSPRSPVTMTLAAEGLDHIVISRMFRLSADSQAETLALTDAGDPFLVRRQLGKGKFARKDLSTGVSSGVHR